MQQVTTYTTAGRPGGREGNPGEYSQTLLDVKAVARMLGCSVRHCGRLADSGQMPPPVKLGGLRRWSPATLEQWIANDCPDLREGGAE